MHMLKNWTKMAAFCLLLTCPAAVLAQPGTESPKPATPAMPADPMALLKVIPADATAFIAVGNLKALDTHVMGIAQQLQLQGIVPSPLDWVKRTTNINQGLNENGGVAFVILNCGDVKTPGEIGNKLALLIPAGDPAALLQAMGGVKAGDVTTVKIMDKESVAAPKDKFLVVAEKAETLKLVLNAKGGGVISTMSPDRVKEFAKQDVFAWANPSTISKELRQQVKDALSGMMAMGALGGAMPAEGGPGDQLDKAIEQSQELSLGISADPKTGLVLSWYGKVKAGTDMAKQMGAMKGVEGSLLAGLPNEPTIFALGSVGGNGDPAYAKQMDQVFSQGFKMYEGMLSTLGVPIEPGKLTNLKDPLVKLLVDMERLAMSFSVLPVEGGDGRLGLVMVAKVKNSQQWQAEARKFFDMIKTLVVEIAKKHGAPEDVVKAVADAVQWKEKAEKTEDAVVDHFVLDIDAIAAAEKDKDAAERNKAELEKVKSFIGKEGVLIRVAAVGADHVVVTFGGGSKRFTQIVQNVKSKQSELAESKEIKKVAARLPKGPRMAEGYLCLDHLLTLISTTMNQMGQPLPVPLALNNAAPIAFTSTRVGDLAAQAEILVPIELMVSVKDVAGQIMMLMGGGMGSPPEQPAPAAKPGGELN